MKEQNVARLNASRMTHDAASGVVRHTPSSAVRLVPPLENRVRVTATEKHQEYEAVEAWFTDCMIKTPSNQMVPATKRYAEKAVTWLPGHHLFDRMPVQKAKDMQYGPGPTKYFIIVDGPQAQDIDNAQYFSGKVREFLWDTFERFKLDLQGAYVTGGHKFWPPYPRMETVPAEWLRLGKKHLLREIELAQPDYILVFGSRPLKILLGNKAKVYSFGGSLVDYQMEGHTAKLIAFNDLYYTHTYQDKAAPGFHSALRVVAANEGVDQLDTEGEYHTITDIDELNKVLEANRGAQTIALDTEWHGESPNRDDGELLLIQFSFRPKEAFVIVLHSHTSGIRFAPNVAAAIASLRQFFLENQDIIIIGQNLRADIQWLEPLGLDITDMFAANGFDTLLASHLIAEEDDHDLTAISMRYTDRGRYDQTAQFMLDKGLTHSKLPDDVLFPYSAADVDVLQRAYPVLKGLLMDDHLRVCKLYGVDPVDAIMSPAQAEVSGKLFIPTLWNLFKHISMPVSKPIREIEREGLPLDEEYAAGITKAYQVVCDHMLEELRQDVGDPLFRPSSPIQLWELYFSDPKKTETLWDGKLRLGKVPLYSTGKRPTRWSKIVEDGEAWWEDGVGWCSDSWKPGLGDDTLGSYADSGCVISAKIRDYRLIRGLLSRTLSLPDEESGDYEKGFFSFLDRDKRIRTHILQLTTTGRWRSFNVNLQNLPKAKEAKFSAVVRKSQVALKSAGFPIVLPSVRSCFLAEEGGLFMEWDLQSAELWTAAYWANDPVFKEALQAKYPDGTPISFHTSAMIKFFKLPYTVEEVDAIMAAGGIEGNQLKMWRTGTKTVNFGVPYGRGAEAICAEVQSYGVECTVDDARMWLEGYKTTFSATWEKLCWAKAQSRDPGYLRNPYGRIRHAVQVNDEAVMAAQEREFANFCIQGTVGDFISDSSVRFVNERDLRGLRTRLVLAIHDALMAWVPYKEIKQADEIAQYAMVTAPGAVVPGIGLRYGIDMEINQRWNAKIDPWFLYDVSEGVLDKRPKCALCKERIASESEKREIKNDKGKKITVCARCAS